MTITFRLLTIKFLTCWTINLFAQQNYNKVDEKLILIKGQIPFSGKKKQIINYLGKADKTEKFQPECGAYAEYDSTVKFQFYTKNSIKYLIYKDEADFSEINFKADTTNFVMFKKFRVSHKTTIDDLKNEFPKSFKEYKNENSGIFRLLFDIKDCDDQIHIFIKNNRVIALGYWTPC